MTQRTGQDGQSTFMVVNRRVNSLTEHHQTIPTRSLLTLGRFDQNLGCLAFYFTNMNIDFILY